MMEETKIRSLYEKYLREENVTHEEMQILLWNGWITALDFVERSPLYGRRWRQYCQQREITFPRLIHAQDFLSTCGKRETAG